MSAHAENGIAPGPVATGAAPPTYWLTRFVILRLLGVVYLTAFLVAANQNLALLGHNGLLPADLFLERAERHFGSAGQGFLALPGIFWWGFSDSLLVTLAWTGVGLSALVVCGFANSLILLALWAVYMSFVHIGQLWYSYGWETQLLETGFLAVFLCPLLDPRPFARSAPPLTILWLYRWLIFRIMLGAGLIKLRGDSCWTDLTALCYHYETQPVPNPVSRLLHFAPVWFQKLGVLWNHFIELVVPWFAFWPRLARNIAGLLLASFQVVLIVTGNLSFLNWLTIVPCLACIDDSVWRRLLPGFLDRAAQRAQAERKPSRLPEVAGGIFAAVVAWLSIAPVKNIFLPDRGTGQIMNGSFDALHLVNTYGAFGTVGRERYEIIFEGTDEATPWELTRWKEYEFKVKPGDPRRRPPIITPYHHRLDWQIWFAAIPAIHYNLNTLPTPDHYPWTVHFAWKLLHNDPAVLGLLAGNPFPDAPPRHIRATVHRYRFAPPGNPDGAWWVREPVREWLPPLSLDKPEVRAFLQAHGLIRPPAN